MVRGGDGGVAVVRLTEAELALPVALGHAHVVHHEHVDAQLGGARPGDAGVFSFEGG